MEQSISYHITTLKCKWNGPYFWSTICSRKVLIYMIKNKCIIFSAACDLNNLNKKIHNSKATFSNYKQNIIVLLRIGPGSQVHYKKMLKKTCHHKYMVPCMYNNVKHALRMQYFNWSIACFQLSTHQADANHSILVNNLMLTFMSIHGLWHCWMFFFFPKE